MRKLSVIIFAAGLIMICYGCGGRSGYSVDYNYPSYYPYYYDYPYPGSYYYYPYGLYRPVIPRYYEEERGEHERHEGFERHERGERHEEREERERRR